MLADYASFYESLQIPAWTLVATGTLILPAVVDESKIALWQSQTPGTWLEYSPGDVRDPLDVVQQIENESLAKSRLVATTAGGKSSKNGLKRKRSLSSVPSSSQNDLSASPMLAHAEETRLPSIDELDRLASNAFVKLQYALDLQHGPKEVYQALFRVYVVPMDAPGLNARINESRLKIRSTAVRAYAQKVLARLFHNLRYDTLEWTSGVMQAGSQPLLAHVQDPSSLMDVYNMLEDPTPKPLQGLRPDASIMLDDILQEDAPEGMYSRLYDFQKTCLWTLAARELAPQRYTDLTYRPLASIDSPQRAYYLDAHSFVWTIAPSYSQPKSAIVSEGMGTGKTCICLALILTTRHQLANIDVDNATLGIVTSVRTEHSESFPWHHEEILDNLGVHSGRAGRSDQAAVDIESSKAFVPSLFSLTLDLLHCSQHIKQQNLDARLHSSSDADLPYLWEIPPNKGRDGTRSESLQRKQVYISAATLVIVPDILVAQWLAEIAKHVKEDALEYIKIEKGDEVPDERELCKLDLVLICESKIRSEESRFWSQSVPVCRCPYAKNTRTIACKCKKVVDRGVSPLVGVYWKRLIVDEGHKVAGHGDLVRLCMRLRTESRFVVSGTPSKNLVGSNDVPTSGQVAASAEADKADFERLANIAAFMGLHPFSTETNTSLLLKAFHEPYRLRGDTSAMQDFLAASVVRHNVPDLALPPLYRDIVSLDFNPLEIVTYNALLALFASNSVLSERQDEDYFFHPKQRGPLNTLVSNLGAAHLLFSSPELIKSLVHARMANEKAFESDLKKTQKGQQGYSIGDQKLLVDAQGHIMRALTHPLWKAAQTGSMIYLMEHLSSQLGKAWSGLLLADEASPEAPSQLFMAGEKISQLRYQIGRQAAGDTDWLVKDGDEFEEELITWAEKEAKRILDEQLAASKPKVKGEPPAKRAKTEADPHSARRAATGAYKKGTGKDQKRLDFEGLPMTSELHFAKLPAIASTKVAYVVKSILEHPEEKFLVFSGGSSSSAQVSANNLYYLAEALDLANIPHLIFVRTLSQEKLAAYAKAFSESSVFRVLLLDLKFAARGLTLSKATRIIFTEPVWHLDEEAQAVKRAHRLGQDRPVFVETLVMRESFEERVLHRRSQLSRQETGNAKTPYEDSQLYDALKTMEFLPDARTEEGGVVSEALTRLSEPISLIPNAFDKEDAAEVEAVLQQIKQESKVDLQELSSSQSRQGSVASARSRSSTPALTRATSSPETLDSTQKLLRPSKSAMKSSSLKKMLALKTAPLMSRRREEDDSEDDDHVFVVTSTKVPPTAQPRKVAFAD